MVESRDRRPVPSWADVLHAAGMVRHHRSASTGEQEGGGDLLHPHGGDLWGKGTVR